MADLMISDGFPGRWTVAKIMYLVLNEAMLLSDVQRL
jgi:hypothetical protein